SDKSVFLELARRHGDYAIVGLAAHNDRFVFFGVGSLPFLLKGGSKDDLKKNLKPNADLYNSAATKLHLAGVLLERAWNTLRT
ncbi:MAG: FAD binding domain-containing protein, partial [Terriglobia bacterium]